MLSAETNIARAEDQLIFLGQGYELTRQNLVTEPEAERFSQDTPAAPLKPAPRLYVDSFYLRSDALRHSPKEHNDGANIGGSVQQRPIGLRFWMT